MTTRNMIVIGRGSNAVRLYREVEGCELRFSDRVIYGNEDLAQLLEMIVQFSPYRCSSELQNLTATTSLSDAVSKVNEILIALSQAGVPLKIWPKLWTNVNNHNSKPSSFYDNAETGD